MTSSQRHHGVDLGIIFHPPYYYKLMVMVQNAHMPDYESTFWAAVFLNLVFSWRFLESYLILKLCFFSIDIHLIYQDQTTPNTVNALKIYPYPLWNKGNVNIKSTKLIGFSASIKAFKICWFQSLIRLLVYRCSSLFSAILKRDKVNQLKTILQNLIEKLAANNVF